MQEKMEPRIVSGTDRAETPTQQESTIRIGAIDVGLPPASGDAIGMMHYITKNRPAIWNIARTYFLGGYIPTDIKKFAASFEDPKAGYEAGIAAVFTILSTGLELGLGYATALRCIFVVEGRATMSADLMRGLAMIAGCRFEYERNDAQACRIIVYRDQKKVGAVEFTMEDAKLAGLWFRGAWAKYPKAMLAARAGSMAARLGAPDRLAGLYDPDEVEQVETTPYVSEEDREVRVINEAARKAFNDGVAKKMQDDIANRKAAADVYADVREALGEPMTDAQRKSVMRLGGVLGIKDVLYVVLPDGSSEKRTIIKSDDEINKVLLLPEGENVRVKNLTKVQATALIEIMLKREEEKAFLAKQAADVEGDEDGYREGQD